MKIGDTIRVVWTDGDVAVGSFVVKERGYIILKDNKGKKIVCNPDHIETFEIIKKSP